MKESRGAAARGNDSGFTLMEVMVALGVFLAVTAATVTILLTALATVRENADRVLAASVARSQVEDLRLAGAEEIPIGLSQAVVSGFTVRTSANWVGVAQQASACSAVSPGVDFIRVNIQVSGRTLTSPQQVDAIVSAEGFTPGEQSGSITISVGDNFDNPVADVLVTATDALHAENNFVVTTGIDGCVFLPALTPTGSLFLSIARNIPLPVYVTPNVGGTTAQAAISTGEVTRTSFEYAPSASIRFEPALADLVVPAGIGVSWQELATGALTREAVIAEPITNLWPTTNLFDAWLGTCADADPKEYAVARGSFNLAAGQLSVVPVIGAVVNFTGLAAQGVVTATYSGSDATCEVGELELGEANENGELAALMPYGSWTFTSQFEEVSQEVSTEGPLEPLVSPEDPAVEIVFDLFVPPDASPSPSPTQSAVAE